MAAQLRSTLSTRRGQGDVLCPAGRAPRQPIRRCRLGRCHGGSVLLTRRQTASIRPLRANSDIDQETSNKLMTGVAVRDISADPSQDSSHAMSPEDIAREMTEQLQDEDEDQRGEGSSPGTKITALPGSFLVLAASLAVTAASGFMGVDVFTRAILPEDPAQLIGSCALWTLPALAYTGIFWYYTLYVANSGAADVLKAEVQDTRYVVEDESIGSIAMASGLLSVAEGLLFRGAGLAVATDLFAGFSLPKPPAEADLFLNPVQPHLPILDLQIFPDYHLPDMWVWPFIALASGALEASLVTLSQDGLKQMDRAFLMSMVSTGLMIETTEAQFVRTNEAGQLVVHKHGQDVPAEDISPEGLLHLTEYLADEFRAQQVRQRNIYVGPAMFMARGTFLSAEALLTGSLFTSLVTGAACYAMESVMSQVYLVKWDTGSSDNYREPRESS